MVWAHLLLTFSCLNRNLAFLHTSKKGTINYLSTYQTWKLLSWLCMISMIILLGIITRCIRKSLATFNKWNRSIQFLISQHNLTNNTRQSFLTTFVSSTQTYSPATRSTPNVVHSPRTHSNMEYKAFCTTSSQT